MMMSSAPVSLRISITDKCQQRCAYCMPPEGVELVPHASILSFEEIIRFVRAMRHGIGVSKVRITGGEPLIRRGVTDFVAMLAAEKIPDIALTTNGQNLPELASDLKRAGLHRINVSLDSIDPRAYAEITRGGDLDSVLAGIEAVLDVGLSPVKINVVAMRGLNDEGAAALVGYALRRGCEIRFIELMPIGCAESIYDERFISAADIRARLEKEFTFEPLTHEGSESSRRFQVSNKNGLRGVVGFITPETEPFCEGCRRLRLTSTGRLIGCLALRDGPKIRHLLGSESNEAADELLRIAQDCLASKQTYHARSLSGSGNRPMVKVGG